MKRRGAPTGDGGWGWRSPKGGQKRRRSIEAVEAAEDPARLGRQPVGNAGSGRTRAAVPVLGLGPAGCGSEVLERAPRHVQGVLAATVNHVAGVAYATSDPARFASQRAAPSV